MKLLYNMNYGKIDVEAIRNADSTIEFAGAESHEEMTGHAPDAEIIMGIGADFKKLFPLCRQLKWVQIGGAGVEWLLTPELVESDVIVTNAQGIFAQPMADHIMVMALTFSRGLLDLLEAKKRHIWHKGLKLQELSGQTMGIVGLGAVGEAVAERARGFGMRVIGLRRHPERGSSFADEVWGTDRLEELMGVSDHIALTLPLTNDTRNIIGRRELEQVKPGAYIYNVGRGKVVDQDALIELLKNGRIAGAGLDVFAREPLEEDSELWDMPNVIISPHHSASSQNIFKRRSELYCENIRRFVAGETLLNVVDKRNGY
ncbi:D-2-hydroxyacid dehydrogenase [Candidatus Hydrogenedentota bacterium]